MYFVNFRWIKWRAAAYASFMRVQVIFQYAHMKRALFNRFAVFVVVVVVYFDFGHLALSQHIQKQIFHNCFFGVFCVVRSIHLLAKRFFLNSWWETANTRITPELIQFFALGINERWTFLIQKISLLLVDNKQIV